MKIKRRLVRLQTLLWAAAAAILLFGCSETGSDSAVYDKLCASCHGRSGQGLRALYPSLEGSIYLGEKITELPCLIATGVRAARDAGDKRRIRMPAFPELTTGEMSSLINYLRQRWGAGGDKVSEQTVGQWLDSCP